MKKFLLAALAALMLAACSTPGIQTAIYTTDDYTLNYPAAYSIQEPTDEWPVFTINSADGRLEVWRPDDFGGDRPFGFTGEETQEELDNYLPKLDFEKGEYVIWIYHAKGDTETADKFQEVAVSFTLLQ